MAETTFASLSPTLLARKGGAKPAMRSQAGPLGKLQDNLADDDLGWNDLGEDQGSAEIIQLSPGNDDNQPVAPAKPSKPRQSALKRGERAAFTLRLDAERHLKLRLASTIEGISAQQLVTKALDALLEDMPEIQQMASQVKSN